MRQACPTMILRCLLTGLLLKLSLVSAYAQPWQPYPDDLPSFDLPGDSLQQQWPLLQRATVQQYPSSEWVNEQLNNSDLCQATRVALSVHDDFQPPPTGSDNTCNDLDHQLIAEHLQSAWRDHFSGNYHDAVRKGEALGPIGYPVGGYARLVYGQLLAGPGEQKNTLFRRAIELADNYETIAPGSAYSLFVSAYAMSQIMADEHRSGALITGYNSLVKERLEKLIQTYPKHAKGAANYGSYNGDIIGKWGHFIARISYSASAEKMESGFASAMKVTPPIISSYVDYTVALEQVYRDKERDKMRQILTDISTLTPQDAEDALAQQRAAALLKRLPSE